MMAVMKGLQCVYRCNKILSHPIKLSFPLRKFSFNNVCYKEDIPGTNNEVNKLNFSSDYCSQVYNYLRSYGFTEKNVSDLITACPQIDTLNPDKLEMTLGAWAKCQFGEGNMVKLLSTHPQLLLAHYGRVDETFMYLYSEFDKKLVLSIFITSPLVITEKIDRISDKIDFLLKMMVSKAEIAHSGALSYSLDYMKERFEFLIRAGKYKIIKEKEKHIGKFKNPRLDSILNPSDHDFSTKIAGLTMLEFEVFREIFRSQD